MTEPKFLPTLRSLGARIKWSRQRAGLTQTQVDYAVGAEMTAKAEQNKVRNPRKIEKLAEVLNVPVEWLLFGTQTWNLSDEALEIASRFDELSGEQRAIVRDLIRTLSK